jgi:hypothetical protein
VGLADDGQLGVLAPARQGRLLFDLVLVLGALAGAEALDVEDGGAALDRHRPLPPGWLLPPAPPVPPAPAAISSAARCPALTMFW